VTTICGAWDGMNHRLAGSLYNGMRFMMLEITCGILLVKEFQGKLLVMVWLVYILI